MASALNKRQQARNERALQELIKTVPGNGVCADCGVRNPGWASWSLGIFLCMRCGALHRKLGTHISKVKSLSMDKWDNAQVDNMKRIGNTESNKIYNPRNVKPQIPIDIDEVDSAMERFLRQKYEQRAFMNDSWPGTRSNTGSSSSVEDRPPPLPPKPTKRFGFGIQKGATLPRNATPPISPGLGTFSAHETSPPRVNKASRVFGSKVTTSGDGLESKLATLRDMGFPDEKRNSTVLKGLNGNLDRAVEALIRLGEQNSGKSRGNTPTPPSKLDMNGLMIKKAQTMPAPAVSTNPFDALDAVAPLPQQQQQQQQQQPQPYGGSVTQPTSPSGSYNPFLQQAQAGQYQQQPSASQHQQQQQRFAQYTNPFGQSQQQQQSLEQSLQGLGLSNQQTQQPLFPNRTGGYNQQPQPPFAQTNPFQQSFTPPPMPQMPPQYGSFNQNQPQQQQHQSLPSPTSPGNPFLKSARSQMFSPSNLSTNPFGQYTSQQQPQQQPPQNASNPFMMQQQTHIQSAQTPEFFQLQQPTYQRSQQPAFQQPQQQASQQPQGAFSKNHIMALYDYPQLAPQRPEQSQTPPTATPAPANAPVAPGPGQMNPFALNYGSQAPQQPLSAVPAQVQGTRHMSHESVDFAGLMGGRHSPDAFSGLSSSFRRP